MPIRGDPTAAPRIVFVSHIYETVMSHMRSDVSYMKESYHIYELQHTYRTNMHCNTLQHTATHCNTLQHTATHYKVSEQAESSEATGKHTAIHYNTLQHTTARCSTLHHSAPHCNMMQHTVTHCNTLQHSNTLHSKSTSRKL